MVFSAFVHRIIFLFVTSSLFFICYEIVQYSLLCIRIVQCPFWLSRNISILVIHFWKETFFILMQLPISVSHFTLPARNYKIAKLHSIFYGPCYQSWGKVSFLNDLVSWYLMTWEKNIIIIIYLHKLNDYGDTTYAETKSILSQWSRNLVQASDALLL